MIPVFAEARILEEREMGWFRKKKLSELPALPFAEVKRRTKVLVIDDDAESFPFELMRREGYSVEHWPRVESITPLQDGQYDIIILDIQGVATHISKDDGLGILELIKDANPSQIVVAFSSHSFDLGKNRFWRLADDSLCKPVDLAMCKRLVDSLIETKRTPQHYWESVVAILERQGVSKKQLARIEDKVASSLERRDADGVSKSLKRVVDHTDTAVRVVGIGVKIAALFGI
jgi:DNA-binding NtrC family response regulator